MKLAFLEHFLIHMKIQANLMQMETMQPIIFSQ